MVKDRTLRNSLGLIGLIGGGLLSLTNAAVNTYVMEMSSFLPELCTQIKSTCFYATGAAYSIGAFGDLAIGLMGRYDKSKLKKKSELENEVNTLTDEKKTSRDTYCDGHNSLGVRRSNGHINAFTYMAEDGTIIHETP